VNFSFSEQIKMEPLPIDPYLPEIASALRTANALILSAPPGAG
jgi:HrpA-like RNA helicase